MRMEERREEEELEWRERMVGLQIQHERQMIPMHAEACQNQMQILGVMARFVCQFFGSMNDGLGGGLGTLPPQILQNLQHLCGLGDNGKPDSSSPPDLDILKKGTGGWKKVVSAFGQGILQPDGEVDRPKLGQIEFSNPEKRQLLNCISLLLAPYISSGIFWEILKLWLKGFKISILDVPLLFKAKMDRWTKPIVFVWVDPETQLQRFMLRDRTREELRMMLENG
ncbi:putative dephospho-CoA kinase [Rosa chinensis]|uniref:Putative dephospho-CoA kinase n=1 Tax=Rosa chinensis TaxID=74649 RepID=A0A2P6SC51_ROSCH|nr:putative dephospho-CoA kinase [Rosa chinensis]